MEKGTVRDESETAANDATQGLQLDVDLGHDALSEETNDCKRTDYELNIVTEANKEKTPQITLEITKPCHLYNVNDIPPVMTSIFSAIQHSLMSICNSFSITFILSELVCAGKDETLKTQLMCSTLFVSGIATLLQSTIGIRLPLYQGPAVEYIIPLVALSNSPEWNCQLAIDAYRNQTNMPGLSSNVTEIPRPVIYEKIQSSVGKKGGEEIAVVKCFVYAVMGLSVYACAPEVVNRMVDYNTRDKLQGSLMFVSVFHILTGATGLVGTLSHYIGPITIIPMMFLVGLYIFRVVVKFSEPHFGIALATSSVALILSLHLRSYWMPLPWWSRKKGFHIIRSPAHNTFSLLFATIVGWALSAVLTASNVLSDDPQSKAYLARTDSKSYVISSAQWIFFPYPGCFGFSLSLSVSTIISFIVAMISSVIDSIADYHACAKISYVASPPSHSVNRGIVVEGIASFLAGMIGIGHGTSSYGGNIGALGITRVASRRVFQIVGIIYILFGILGKLSAIFVTIPFPVLGGIQLIYFGSFIGIVLSNFQKIAMSHRNLTIIGVSIMVGMAMPRWIHENSDLQITGDAKIDNALLAILRNPNFLGGFMAFLLDNFWPGTLEERGLISVEEDEQMDYSKDSILINGPHISEKSVYGIPFYPRWLTQWKVAKYIPFLPPYE